MERALEAIYKAIRIDQDLSDDHYRYARESRESDLPISYEFHMRRGRFYADTARKKLFKLIDSNLR